MSFAAITVIAACLLITATFGLVAYNIDLLIKDLEKQSEIVVYIDDSVSREDAVKLGDQIRALDNVQSAEFVTKEQLFDDYLAGLGSDAYVMEGLKDDNPLRDSYRVTMKDVSKHAETVAALEKVAGVASSSSSKEVSDRLIQIRRVTNLISYTLIAMPALRPRPIRQQLLDIRLGPLDVHPLLRHLPRRRQLARLVVKAQQRPGMTADAFLSDAERALAYLGQVTGETAAPDIAQEIFARFCVGK